MEKLTEQKIRFIKEVARDQGINIFQIADIRRAHEFASDGSEDDYYYRLKEFFIN